MVFNLISDEINQIQFEAGRMSVAIVEAVALGRYGYGCG
jgi:hypothetical protein